MIRIKKKIICGIYKVTNKINGKIYIGQSQDIFKRWGEHCSSSKNYNDNYVFHKAIRKYGKENFTWEILEECKPKDIPEKEMYYIEYYRTYIGFEDCNGYNMTLGGEGVRAGHRKVDKYDLNNNYVCTYNSLSEAARENNVSRKHVYLCCNKQCMSANDFQFFYHGEKPIKPFKRHKTKKVVQYDLNANLIAIYDSRKEAEKATGIKHYNIARSCRENNSVAGGFMWRYEGDSPPKPYVNSEKRKVNQYDLDGNFIKTFDSISDAFHSLNLTSGGNIIRCCKGDTKTAYGYHWEYF